MYNYRAGLAAAATHNVFRRNNTEPIQPLSFFEQEKPSALKIMNSLDKIARNAERKRGKNGKSR